jgi:hypothetical protein
MTGLHLFHDWLKWEKPFEKFAKAPCGHRAFYLGTKQRRECVLCGKIQERSV